MRPAWVRWAWAVAASLGLGLASVAVALTLRLGDPKQLLWAVVAAAMPLAYAGYEGWRVRVAERLGETRAVMSLVEGSDLRVRLARAALATMAVWLLSVAVARPQWGERPREIQRRGIDIVFAVDLSRSMWATDLVPDRLQATIHQLERFIRRLEGDRVGLVVFAADAVVQSPLTSDYGAIRHYLNRVSPEHFSRQGTAVGRAIQRATQLLVGGNDESFRRAQTQLIIVLTDGEDTRTQPVAAAEAALAEGIHVYTVGVGTPEGATIPLRNADGTIASYVTDRRGEIVTSRLAETQLIEVARAGGGEYLRLGADGTLEAFLDTAIARYEEEVLTTMLRMQYEERYEFFAVPAWLLLMVALALRDRPRRRNAALLTALVVGLTACDDTGWLEREDPWVNQAIEATDGSQIEEARLALERASAETRALPAFHYAAGWIEEQAEAWEAAQREYLRALSAEDVPAQVRALTALGNVLLAREEYAAAVERYRRALVLDPTWEPARRNLEIALRRQFPPCTSLDTTLEPNNEAAAAQALPAAVYQGDFVPPGITPAAPGTTEEAPTLTACPLDADWYLLPSVAGAKYDIEVSFTRLRDDTGGPPPPATIEPTAIRIALLGADGVDALGVDQGLAAGTEPVAAERVRRRMEGVEIPANYTQNTPIYLKVEVDEPLEYTYTVEITVHPPCSALDDELEANDIRSTARALEPSEHQVWTCPGNDDWYSFVRSPDETAFIEFRPATAQDGTPGVLTVEFYEGDAPEPFRTVQLDATSGSVLEQRFAPFDLAPPDPTAPQPVAPADTTEPPAPERIFARVINNDPEFQGGYALGFYRYGACPTGDDRFEENDQGESRRVFTEEERPPFRFLRLCEGDVDWFEVTVPPAPEEEAEGSGAPPSDGSRPFSMLVEAVLPWQVVDGAMFEPVQGQRVAALAPAEGLPPGTPPSWLAAATFAAEAGTAIVAVAGTPGYYHLSFPELEQQQQQQQEQEQQQSDQQEGSGEPQDEPQEGSGEPNEGSSDPNEPEEGSGQQPEPSEEPEEEQAEAQPSEPELSDEELSRQQLQQLLDSLEQDDVNLQVEQATRDLPPERFDEEW